ncbi:MAG: YdcF family protein [Micavibrio aeruginosavorus]|uniref:YdcF family protein n=1 Tax=Micavibrio aeruginosavorus TaxID=349221 RepID=A0A7T5UH51_9BACT|nr:MAG: YdcF family protein [Micavibrio aeruginosavorus]
MIKNAKSGKNPFQMKASQWAMTVMTSAIFLWLSGFVLFTQYVRSIAAEVPERPADAIIVLTGGAQRVNQGLDLLAQGQAKKLFITGVNGHVTLEEILNLWKRPIIKHDDDDCCIILDHKAQNTIQNARETKFWVRQQGIKTIRLVTSDYHMPRARLEFRASMPDVKILPWPVKSINDPEYRTQFWYLCFEEYNKSLVTVAKIHITPPWLRKYVDQPL